MEITGYSQKASDFRQAITQVTLKNLQEVLPGFIINVIISHDHPNATIIETATNLSEPDFILFLDNLLESMKRRLFASEEMADRAYRDGFRQAWQEAQKHFRDPDHGEAYMNRRCTQVWNAFTPRRTR